MKRRIHLRATRRDALIAALGIGGGIAMDRRLVGLFQPTQPTGTAAPVTYRQGEIISFNQVTLENVVRIGATNVPNMPILGVAEASTLTPGSRVGILFAGNGSGGFIIGRLVTPNTPLAAEAISLGSAFYQTNFIAPPAGTIVSNTFGDLTGTDAGPTVTLTVGPSGRVEVTLGSTVGLDAAFTGSAVNVFAAMGVDLTGANTRAPGQSPTLFKRFRWNATTPAATSFEDEIEASRTFAIEGLTPGETVFKALYISDGTHTATFNNRFLGVRRL